MQQKENRASSLVPAGLLVQVLDRLDKEKRLNHLRHKLTVVSSCLCGAVVFLLPVSIKFWEDTSRSGSRDFAMLTVTDSKVVTDNLSIYVYGLLESLPVVSFIIFSLLILTVLVLFILFAKYKVLARRLAV